MSELDAGPSTSKPRAKFITRRPVEFKQDARVYKMDRRKRTAVIFNHNTFKPDAHPNTNEILSDRPGTEIDVERLKIVLNSLYFDVTVHDDLNHSDLYAVIKELKDKNYDDQDCLAIFVLTHGVGSKLASSDYLYDPEELWCFFTGNNCPSLAGKPKLFFINACRGDKHDDGVEFYNTDLNLTIDGNESTFVGDALYKLPSMADIYVAFSTAQGFVSNREPDRGTWFIQCLCDNLSDEHVKKMEFKQILTRTSQEVASMVNKFQSTQVPTTVSTLIRDLYLC